MKSTRTDEPVQSITDAPEALEDLQAKRFRTYAIQMSIRTLCFLGFVLVDHWIRWVLALGAVLLPYVAVLLVNSGRDVTSRAVIPVDHARISAGPASTEHTTAEPPTTEPPTEENHP